VELHDCFTIISCPLPYRLFFQDLPDMIGTYHRMNDFLNTPVRSDHECRPVHGRKSPAHKLCFTIYVKLPGKGIVSIGDQWIRKSVFLFEVLVLLHGIFTDADDRIALFRQCLMMIADMTCFDGTSLRPVMIVEEQDKGFAFKGF